MSEAKDADVDRLTLDRLWTSAFQAYGEAIGDKPEAMALRRYIEQSLSQEAVRDEVLEEAARVCDAYTCDHPGGMIVAGAVGRAIRALKREPNAAAQVPQTLAASIGRESDVSSEGSPAPAAPDAASMVKRAIKEMRFFQSVRSRVPADAQYDEWIALLARLGQRIETRKESEHPSNYEFPPAPGASDE